MLLLAGLLCDVCDAALDLLEVSRCECWMAAMEALIMVPCKRANREGPQFDACTTAVYYENEDHGVDSSIKMRLENELCKGILM